MAPVPFLTKATAVAVFLRPNVCTDSTLDSTPCLLERERSIVFNVYRWMEAREYGLSQL